MRTTSNTFSPNLQFRKLQILLEILMFGKCVVGFASRGAVEGSEFQTDSAWAGLPVTGQRALGGGGGRWGLQLEAPSAWAGLPVTPESAGRPRRHLPVTSLKWHEKAASTQIGAVMSIYLSMNYLRM